MALTKAESAALYRARHPDRVAAYLASDKAKANSARRQAAYRKRHPERVAAYAKSDAAKEKARIRSSTPEAKAKAASYYLKNIESAKAKRRAYYLANKEKFVERAKLWAKKNPDRYKEIVRGVAKRRRHKDVIETREWRRNNPEKYAEQSRRWREANRARLTSKERLRYAAKIKAVPAWANEFFVGEIYDLAKRRTQLTGIRWEVDHIVPLKSKLVCGLHCENNLAVIPREENRRKRNHYWPDMP